MRHYENKVSTSRLRRKLEWEKLGSTQMDSVRTNNVLSSGD